MNEKALKEIETLISKILRSPADYLIKPDEAQNLVSNILLSAIPTYRHPLGFLHSELTDFLSDIFPYDRVREHIFEREYASHATSPSVAHSHEWNLRSHVLTGVIENSVYDFKASRDGQYKLGTVIYDTPTNARIELSESQGNLETVSSTTYRAGEVYKQEATLLHSTKIITNWVATLVFSQSTPARAQVVFRNDNVGAPKNNRQLVAHSEKTRVLDQIDFTESL